MNGLILASLFLPMLGFLLILASAPNEHRIARISLWTARLMGSCVLTLLATWSAYGFPNHEFVWFDLYARGDYHFPILFYLDVVGATYLFCAWAIFAIIVRYCRVYLHREPGYKRFFLTIFGFSFGLNLVILSGSIDMLFAGWEIVGVCSFLLIAFYRHRPQPVRNALRAYTIYRFCDVGLLLGAWMSHLLFHESQHFSELANLFDHAAMPPAGYASLLFLSWLIVIAASGKSAQFPFCFWLPRAMEGPTPSSAIFYGALSIHLGVFLLLRTMPIWSYHYLSRLVVLAIGLLTIVVASLSEKTQSNIKGQIAYASITQVGFMFVELAFGLEPLVLMHFLGNAFLRCYQLLVSPSIVAHLLRVEGSVDTDFVIKPSAMRDRLPYSIRDTLPGVLQNTLYVFALQEGNLERLVRMSLWDPLKGIGSRANAVRPAIKYLVLFSVLALIPVSKLQQSVDPAYLSMPVSLAMVLATLGAFSQNRNPLRVWHAIALSCLLAGAAVWMMTPEAAPDVLLFASGIVPSWLLGIFVLKRLLRDEDFAAMPFRYRALAETQPGWSLLLFLSFLGLVGFPITPAFLGEDLLLAHATNQHPWFALPITIAFVVNGIAAARVFVRLCMGRPAEVRPLET
ncbi:NADH-quinone oxidoreductase subunit E [Methylococcaceae bacterium WWC4]|nr:NADH-quinone oxidoreductase subunit E [Methylococcaceae bacterium WWC4]